jgi:hypothetical protein
LFNNAVQWLTGIQHPTTEDLVAPITPALLWAALLGSLSKQVPLASGVLTLPSPASGAGEVDTNKWRGLLRVDHIWNTDTNQADPPVLIYGCGSTTISTPDTVAYTPPAPCRPMLR